MLLIVIILVVVILVMFVMVVVGMGSILFSHLGVIGGFRLIMGVKIDIVPVFSLTELGYLPGGWQW